MFEVRIDFVACLEYSTGSFISIDRCSVYRLLQESCDLDLKYSGICHDSFQG